MLALTLKVSGADDVLDMLNGIADRATQAIPEVLGSIAVELSALMKENAHTAEHQPGLPHIEPGDGRGPNMATGTLLENIRIADVHETGEYAWTTDVGAYTVYARALEYGLVLHHGWAHPTGRFTGPKFPYVQPAAEQVIREVMPQAVDRILEGLGV